MTKWLPDGAPDHTEYYAERLSAYRANFENTENGAWAWMAIHLCLGGEMPWDKTPLPQIPDWVFAYLREVAAFIYNVGMPEGLIIRPPTQADYKSSNDYEDALKSWNKARISNPNAPELMLKTLKLDGPRKFREFSTDMEAYQTLLMAIGHGRGKSAVIEEIQRREEEGKPDSFDDPDTIRKRVDRQIKRALKNFSYLKNALPPKKQTRSTDKN